MNSVVHVRIHSSQFPENVRRDLLASLRSRRVNHKFHYDSIKQTQKWLTLHQQYSPTRKDDDCVAMYEKSFAAAAKRIEAKEVHVVGLGCGGGQKDTRLLKLLRAAGREVSYTPSDVATAMVLVARQAALSVVPNERCFPLVCDLTSADDLPAVFASYGRSEIPRLFTFFGMIPNFEPEVILPRLASFIRPQDWLVFSANLAPGKDYGAGVREILPQYENELTREWLLTFLLDLGVERGDGALEFKIETNFVTGLQRVTAHFHFRRPRRIAVESEQFEFLSGDSIQLFFSYRYTPELAQRALTDHGLEICETWAAISGEEGVFLCHKGR